MAIQTIKCGGFVAEEISKVNANFTELNTNKAETSAIPTKTSQLTNDSGYITSSAIPTVPTKTSDLTNDSGFITSSAVPTKTSQLTNDSNFVNQTQLTNAIAAVDIPTKTSDLTNDSNFVTTTTMNSALANKVDVVSGKGLSTNDYTTDEKTKLAGLSAPTKVSFTTSNWSSGTYTTAANGKMPAGVMRKNGSNYESVFVDVQVVGTNVVITSDEAFEGYLILV